MRRKQPDPVTEARRALDEALYAIRAHRQHCSPCAVAGRSNRPAHSCDLGWAYLKLERQAAAALRAAEATRDALNGRQLALW